LGNKTTSDFDILLGGRGSLIKALPKQRFKSFINMIKIIDIKEWLAEEKQLEDLREKVRARRKNSDEIMV
jgi:hypothetical protein